MPRFIKNRADEKRWKDAISLTKKRISERDTNPNLDKIENVFAYANYLYHNVLEENNNSVVVETKGLINSYEDEQIWEAIKFHTFSQRHDLNEEQKYEHIEEVFSKYKEKHNNDTGRQRILEFVSTYGTTMGSGLTAAPYGLLGGYRDEKPKGPYVFGYNDGMDGVVPPSKPNAVVIVHDKKDDYKPTQPLDNQGNVISDVENSQKIEKEKATVEDQLNGPIGDLIVYLSDEMNIPIDELQEMDSDELIDLIKKVAKKEMEKAKTLTESYDAYSEEDSEEVITEKRDSPIAKARKVLALKHKQKKSLEKINGKKFILNQNDIIKLMSRYGYKYDKKYKKWVKKRSPTFDARRILSDKYQDSEATRKDNEGNYLLDQDEIRKKMHAHNYKYDLNKKRWVQHFDTPEQPEPVTVDEPKELPVNSPTSIYQPSPIKQDEPVDKINIEKPKKDEKEEPKEDKKPKEIKPENPMNNLEIKSKMKEMEARFILNVAHGDKQATEFTKNEETGEYIPTITKDDILNKISLLKYEWDEQKTIWLNDANSLPNVLFDLKENQKSIIARGYLAAIGKINRIKTKSDNTPSVAVEDIDEDMENEEFYFNSELNKWVYIGEDEKDDLDEDISYSDVNDVDYDEEILCESYDVELYEEDKIVRPIHDYNLAEVSDTQARLLLRALQLDHFQKHYVGTPNEQSAFMKIQNGVNNDPTAFDKDTPKMSQNLVDSQLNKLSYDFNNNKEKPMWVKNGENSVPKELKKYGIDEKNYIARGILGSNKKDYIYFDTSKSSNIQPLINNKKVENVMISGKYPYNWNDEYGWIRNKPEDLEKIPSKSEMEDIQSVKSFRNIPIENMNRKEKEQYLLANGGKKLSEINGGKKWSEMNDSEKKKNWKATKLKYKFNDKTNKWERNAPINKSFINKVGSSLKWITSPAWAPFWAANKIRTSRFGRIMKSVVNWTHGAVTSPTVKHWGI